jgi:peroxiredoxin family protein
MEEGAISGKVVDNSMEQADTEWFEQLQARTMSGGTAAYQCASTYELLTRQISRESRTRYISGRCKGVVSAGLGAGDSV